MLPVPWALLGARRYLSELSGESSAGEPFYNTCGLIHEKDWLNQDIPSAATSVRLGARKVLVMASSFVALKSVATPLGDCSVGEAMNHNCKDQRNHLDDDVSMWYQAFEPSMYPAPVSEAFGALVRHIGTGPWGAGVWYGDSQMYFLTVWLATGLLQGASLDYYLYDHFCENPANQCFLLGEAGCGECISTSAVDNSPVDAERCGSQSLWGIVDRFKNLPAQDLYQALKAVDGPPTQVFDLLAPGTMSAPEGARDGEGEDAVQDPRELVVHLAGPSEAVARPEPGKEAVTAAPSRTTSTRVPEAETTTNAGAVFKYSFAGYHRADGAEGACGKSAVAMPKTREERQALKDAIAHAIKAGDMEEAWPQNTIWLGGRWSSSMWAWNNGEPANRLDWAEGQPSGDGHQEEEPYLCMVADGKVHDSGAGSPPYVFGVMCQEPAGKPAGASDAEAQEGPLLKVEYFPREPVDDDFQSACLAGNDLYDGWKYIFNEGRGTRNAACGELAEYWCCKRHTPTESRSSVPTDFWQQILTR